MAWALKRKGLFAFSVEALATGSYRFQSNGRYSHTLDYLRKLAAASGFSERAAQPVAIRCNQDGVAAGHLVLLERL